MFSMLATMAVSLMSVPSRLTRLMVSIEFHFRLLFHGVLLRLFLKG